MNSNADHVSVVVQGPVLPATRRTIASIRQHLPGAVIILSTWEGEGVTEAGADHVVLSVDPGALPPSQQGAAQSNNINRQIVSTREGLRLVQTPYAVKIRSDAYLEHAGFMDFLVPDRLLVSQFFTLDPTMFAQVTYHLGDWFHAGPTERMRQYWNAPLMSVEDATWYDYHSYAEHSRYLDRGFRCRLPAEQFLTVHYAQQLGYAVPHYHNENTPLIRHDHWRFLAEQVIVLDISRIGLSMPKYRQWLRSPLHHYHCMSYLDWRYMAGDRSLQIWWRHCQKRLLRTLAAAVEWLRILQWSKKLYVTMMKIGRAVSVSSAPRARYTPVPQAMIASQYIAIVIQGPLHRQKGEQGIEGCIASILQHAPEAEIIVVAWAGEEVAGLIADKILELPDPGGITDACHNTTNVGRQAYAAEAGMRAATRPWILKIRTDTQLESGLFFGSNAFGNGVPASQRLLMQPISMLDFITRDPSRVPFLFHLSDLVQFGRREDMLNFWSGEPFTAAQLCNQQVFSWNPIGNWLGATSLRAYPEQALMLRWLAKHGMSVRLPRPDALTFAWAQQSEQMLLSHFCIVCAQASGIVLPARLLSAPFVKETIYKPAEAEIIARNAFNNYRMRYIKIWTNKYIFAVTSRFWYWATIPMMLTRVSPALSKYIRDIYRQRKAL